MSRQLYGYLLILTLILLPQLVFAQAPCTQTEPCINYFEQAQTFANKGYYVRALFMLQSLGVQAALSPDQKTELERWRKALLASHTSYEQELKHYQQQFEQAQAQLEQGHTDRAKIWLSRISEASPYYPDAQLSLRSLPVSAEIIEIPVAPELPSSTPPVKPSESPLQISGNSLRLLEFAFYPKAYLSTEGYRAMTGGIGATWYPKPWAAFHLGGYFLPLLNNNSSIVLPLSLRYVLTPTEQWALYAGLGGFVRLEQDRLPWGGALAEVGVDWRLNRNFALGPTLSSSFSTTQELC
jgi:hypothetical protein